MNRLIPIALVCISLMSTGVLAHSDHGHVSDQQAISIAAKSIKKLAFKDYGFEVGKLNDSWKGISSEAFTVVNESDDTFIIQASNDSEQVYFKIAKNGQLLDVKPNDDF
jgi:hypothetical protein